jgi:hypothetical protein
MTDDQFDDEITISFVGRDDDGYQLAIITADEAYVGSIMLELLRRGDDNTPWWDLACGPGGWVHPPGEERFRVMRIVNAAGKVLHDYESE